MGVAEFDYRRDWRSGCLNLFYRLQSLYVHVHAAESALELDLVSARSVCMMGARLCFITYEGTFSFDLIFQKLQKHKNKDWFAMKELSMLQRMNHQHVLSSIFILYYVSMLTSTPAFSDVTLNWQTSDNQTLRVLLDFLSNKSLKADFCRNWTIIKARPLTVQCLKH